MRPLLLLVLLAGVAACAPARHTATDASAASSPRPPADSASGLPETARALVEAVRARHGATWYRTLAFVQETTFHTPSGPRVQTWYEAGAVPGRLRIDVAPLGEAGTFLFTVDSTFLAPPGRPVVRRGGGNPLMLFGFDIVTIPADVTLAGMAALGIDTTAVRADVWEARPAIVVGAAPGDTTAPQVWFDRERLVFVRLIERQGDGLSEVRFRAYEPLGGGWIAPHVEAYQNGVLVQEERYRAIRADVVLPEGTFDTHTWPSVAWWTAVGYDGTE
ncbi:MAG TPA: hypothetical protein VGB53_08340 [Rubricoccaceae bacterium]|jgi:hypothetical protein